jgi:hypothetical protein
VFIKAILRGLFKPFLLIPLIDREEDSGLTVGEQSDSGRNLVELVDLLHCLCLEIRNLYLCLSDIIYIFIYIY